MKKQKVVFRFLRYEGESKTAKREVSFELQFASRLLLDELCFNVNKNRLEEAINDAIDTGNEELFIKLSEEYRHFIWE